MNFQSLPFIQFSNLLIYSTRQIILSTSLVKYSELEFSNLFNEANYFELTCVKMTETCRAHFPEHVGI